MVTLGCLLVGLVLLAAGAELLVRGAAQLASAAGISPLVIGLTVVAFGTSSPELVVSIVSALRGEEDVALGNVVGSNIMNVLLILGLSAIITPLQVSRQLIRIDVPIMIGLSAVLWLMARDNQISAQDGTVLFASLCTYTFWLIAHSRGTAIGTEMHSDKTSLPPKQRLISKRNLINCLMAFVGLSMLVFGSHLLVTAAVSIARYFGLSELVIGLTIVAVGTSLPEIATSVMASLRGEREIAVGNVVGSNVYNIACVLGLSGMIGQGGVSVSAAALSVDIPVMVLVAIVCLPVFFTGQQISRWEGAGFLTSYIAYTWYRCMP